MQVRDRETLRRMLSTPHVDIANDLLALVSETGALLKGHFQLQSGRHSPFFLRFSQFGWSPAALGQLARWLLERAPFAGTRATILCPESAGIYLGRAIADITGFPLAVAVVDSHRHPTSRLRVGTVNPAQPVLLVNDIVTTGDSIGRLVPLIKDTQVTGVLTFAVLSTYTFRERMAADKMDAEWLISALWETFEPGLRACPLCREGLPLLLAEELN